MLNQLRRGDRAWSMFAIKWGGRGRPCRRLWNGRTRSGSSCCLLIVRRKPGWDSKNKVQGEARNARRGAGPVYYHDTTIQSTDQYMYLDWYNWPNVEYPDIFNYFVTSVSTYTKQQLEAYKSLDGYMDGWIQDFLFGWYPLKLMLVLCTGKLNIHKTTTVCLHPSAT